MLPDFLKNKTIAVWDIEADLVPSTEVYCISVSIISVNALGHPTIKPAIVFTQYWTPYTNGSNMEAVTMINNCDFNCGHNILGYDIPMVIKLLGSGITSTPLDTLILSKIVFSKDDLFAMDPQLGLDKELYGRYSLKAFGQRFGDFKIDYNDFSHLNEEMTVYCNQDTDLAARLLLFLAEKENFPILPVIEVENKAASIIAEQTEFGFYLDIELTRALNTKLLKERGELSRELLDIFSPKFLRDGKVKSYKKPSKVKKYLPNTHYQPLLGTKD